MRVTLAQIEAFYWIVRLGSFRDAARHIGRTQPSISLRVQELEAALGERLLERDGRRVHVTLAGARSLGYADRMLELTGELEGIFNNGRLSRERIRLGSVDSFAMTCLPGLLRAISQISPDTHVEVTVDYSPNLQERLNNKQFDICFLIAPEDRPFLTRERLCSVNMVWVAGGEDRGRWGNGVYQPRDLADQVIFSLPQPAAKRSFGWFTSNGVEPTRVNLCNNPGIVAHLIRAGLGIGLVPRCLVQTELRNGLVSEIKTSPSVAPEALEVVYMEPFPFRMRTVLEAARAIVASQGDI
jgi:DNA-binding transcriptional LysR family regulator